jgi:Ankyrin repeats (3 copies)
VTLPHPQTTHTHNNQQQANKKRLRIHQQINDLTMSSPNGVESKQQEIHGEATESCRQQLPVANVAHNESDQLEKPQLVSEDGETDSQSTSDDGDDSDDDDSCDSSSCSDSEFDSDAEYETYEEENEGTMTEDLAPRTHNSDGLYLSLEVVQLLRLNTSEGNIFKGNAAFENLVPQTVPRRGSEGGGATSNIVYAVQTKSAMDDRPGNNNDENVLKPKQVVTQILEAHGHSFQSIPYQDVSTWVKGCTASYNLTLMDAVRKDNVDTFRAMHASGCNLQCANKWGETILHAVARYGRLDIMEFLVEEANISLNVCCDGGRTVLHDGCWTVTPHWDCISYILQRVPGVLFVADKRGFTPLDYVPKDAWADWQLYLESVPHLIVPDMHT